MDSKKKIILILSVFLLILTGCSFQWKNNPKNHTSTHIQKVKPSKNVSPDLEQKIKQNSVPGF